MDVDVDADALVAAPCGAQGEVRHFGADAGEGDEACEGGGDVGVVGVAQDLGGALDVVGFEVVEADFVDEGVEGGGGEGEDGFEG